jgi:hypothetical protein
LRALTDIRSLTALVAISAALLSAGCGGKSGEETQSRASQSTKAKGNPTKADFIRQAEAICLETDRVQKRVQADYTQKNPNSSVAASEKALLAAGLEPVRTEAKELAALHPPTGDKREIEAIVSALEKAVKTAEKDPNTLGLGKRFAFAEVEKLAGEYGFDECEKAL